MSKRGGNKGVWMDVFSKVLHGLFQLGPEICHLSSLSYSFGRSVISRKLNNNMCWIWLDSRNKGVWGLGGGGEEVTIGR